MERKRILIAGGEMALRKLLAAVLKVGDYNLNFAANQYETIHYIKRRSYHLIILDHMMPELDGLDLIRSIRSKYPFIPILILTNEGPRHFLRSGATACILKPFNIIRLQEMVKALLRQQKAKALKNKQEISLQYYISLN